MPTLKKTEEEKQHIELLSKLAYYRQLRGISKSELATAGRMSLRTYYQREDNPGDFKLEELQLIAKKLRTSVVELIGGQAS